jgi:hypothetical protein
MKKNSLLLICICLSLIAVLTSCTSPDIRPDYSLSSAQQKGHGLLIGVITANTRHTTFNFQTRFFLTPQDNQPILNPNLQLDTDCPASVRGDIPGPGTCSHYFAVDLPAGQYTLRSWNVSSMGFFPYSVNPLIWVPQPFTIYPGKATYIGHIYMNLDYQHSKIAHDVYDGWPDIMDDRSSDIPQLQKEYPVFDQNKVVFNILMTEPRSKTIICPCP